VQTPSRKGLGLPANCRNLSHVIELGLRTAVRCSPPAMFPRSRVPSNSRSHFRITVEISPISLIDGEPLRFKLFACFVVLLMLLTASLAGGHSQTARASKTKIDLLGTGNPSPARIGSQPETSHIQVSYQKNYGGGLVCATEHLAYPAQTRSKPPSQVL
jgi:hypothetical protein